MERHVLGRGPDGAQARSLEEDDDEDDDEEGKHQDMEHEKSQERAMARATKHGDKKDEKVYEDQKDLQWYQETASTKEVYLTDPVDEAMRCTLACRIALGCSPRNSRGGQQSACPRGKSLEA